MGRWPVGNQRADGDQGSGERLVEAVTPTQALRMAKANKARKAAILRPVVVLQQWIKGEWTSLGATSGPDVFASMSELLAPSEAASVHEFRWLASPKAKREMDIVAMKQRNVILCLLNLHGDRVPTWRGIEIVSA